MRKWIRIPAIILLVTVSLPLNIGMHLVRCAHSGRVVLAEFNGTDSSDDTGMDGSCMQHFFFKVSDYTASQTREATPVLAVISVPLILCGTPASPRQSVQTFPSARDANAPPGNLLHVLRSLKN